MNASSGPVKRSTAMSIFSRSWYQVAAIVVITGVAATATGCAGETASPISDSRYPALIEKAISAGELVVGTSVNAPIAYVDNATKKLAGIDADILREYIDRKGLTDKVAIRAETMDFSSLIPALQSNRIAFMVDSMFVTDERKKVVSFTDTIFYNPEALIVPTGNPDGMSSLSDLCGATAASYEGSAFLAQLEAANEDCGSDPIDIKTYPKVEDVINDIAAGRLDAGLIDATVAAYGVDQNPDLGIELSKDYTPADKTETAASNAVSPGNDDFIRDYNTVLAEMKSDGRLAEILTENGLSPAEYFLEL
jgi:polar amino acid transport system substrate-binding protein